MILPTTNLEPDIENLVASIQYKKIALAYAKIKKSSSHRSFRYCICWIIFKITFVAPHALQQTKSGHKSKKVGTTDLTTY